LGACWSRPRWPCQPPVGAVQLQLPKETLENIRNTPDFILLKPDHTDVVFVDVKYRKTLQPLRVLELANKVEQTWPGAWLFLATLDGFYVAPCPEIQSRGGAFPSSDQMDQSGAAGAVFGVAAGVCALNSGVPLPIV
jgi:hypothetical protein